MKRIPIGLALVVSLGSTGCRAEDASPAQRSAAPAPSTEPAPVSLSTLSEAEHRRQSATVPEGALSARDVTIRRAAARALARIADERAASFLSQALSDDDPVVVAWAAYGLGYACGGREIATVRALVARAATWFDRPTSLPEDSERPERFELDVTEAIAGALARCGTDLAERTLRAWLDEPGTRASAAALGLGRLARRRNRLMDATLSALFEAATRDAKPLDEAVWALSQAPTIAPTLAPRLRDAAERAVEKGGRARVFGILAAGRAGPDSTTLLTEVLADAEVPPAERALAATELGKLGVDGQSALRNALQILVQSPRALNARDLVGNDFVTLSAVLGALEPPVHGLAEPLKTLAELPISDEASAAHKRRVIDLRCEASALLAGAASLSSRLVRCDPRPDGVIGALAVLKVLDRGELSGARYRRWRGFLASKSPLIRREALALLGTHPETPDSAKWLSDALDDQAPGVVAVAARLIARFPALADAEGAGPKENDQQGQTPAFAPAPELVKSLSRALSAERPPDHVETRAALIEAAGALQLLSAKPRIEKVCLHPNPTLRRAARRALARLGDTATKCDAPGSFPPPPVALDEMGDEPMTVTFVTEAGRLGITLHPALAPAAVHRLATLAKNGFFDGQSMVRDDWVVQLGDPVGDGYGGAGLEPLRCETSPVPFDAFAVGLALSGRDTGSSQIFVTLMPQPKLTGDYPLLGWADPEWAAVATGDRIERVLVKQAE